MKTHGMDTLWPEAGKRYRLRNGMITGPMLEDADLATIGHPDRFETAEKVDGFFGMWRSNGRATFFGSGSEKENRPYDIVEEYTE